jgi:hypothetical protein
MMAVTTPECSGIVTSESSMFTALIPTSAHRRTARCMMIADSSPYAGYFARRRSQSSRRTPPTTAGAGRQRSSTGSVRIGWAEVTPPIRGVSTP